MSATRISYYSLQEAGNVVVKCTVAECPLYLGSGNSHHAHQVCVCVYMCIYVYLMCVCECASSPYPRTVSCTFCVSTFSHPLTAPSSPPRTSTSVHSYLIVCCKVSTVSQLTRPTLTSRLTFTFIFTSPSPSPCMYVHSYLIAWCKVLIPPVPFVVHRWPYISTLKYMAVFSHTT